MHTRDDGFVGGGRGKRPQAARWAGGTEDAGTIKEADEGEGERSAKKQEECSAIRMLHEEGPATSGRNETSAVHQRGRPWQGRRVQEPVQTQKTTGDQDRRPLHGVDRQVYVCTTPAVAGQQGTGVYQHGNEGDEHIFHSRNQPTAGDARAGSSATRPATI